MKLLVIGGGGREHALVWKLAQSQSVSKIWCIPGNGGISQQAECIVGDLTNVSGLADIAAGLRADLTIVGPEQPLVCGIADEFSRRGLKIVGPSRECSQLEGSKVFAKEFLKRHEVPTAEVYGTFVSADDAVECLDRIKYPVVLKADGLCAGKGVLVANSIAEARAFVDQVLVRREFAEGGSKLLIEEALFGEELSFIVLADGHDFVPLVPTRDHKRAMDSDRGPNTGGMGAYSCDQLMPDPIEIQILEDVVRPTMAAIANEGWAYCGFLYFGLMLTETGPKVLEFNCRLGDPEAQAIVTRMDFDLADVLLATAEGRLQPDDLKWRPGASVCVVAASAGYPGKFAIGEEIQGLESASKQSEVAIFHAGTKKDGNTYYTSSGRVLGVTAWAEDLDGARRKAYEAVDSIYFRGCQYRRDIALSACHVCRGPSDPARIGALRRI